MAAQGFSHTVRQRRLRHGPPHTLTGYGSPLSSTTLSRWETSTWPACSAASSRCTTSSRSIPGP
eukprot:13388685-Heterocapsa_arctica.AAC.1